MCQVYVGLIAKRDHSQLEVNHDDEPRHNTLITPPSCITDVHLDINGWFDNGSGGLMVWFRLK